MENRRCRGCIKHAKRLIDVELVGLEKRLQERWDELDKRRNNLDKCMDDFAAEHGGSKHSWSDNNTSDIPEKVVMNQVVTFNVGGRRISARRKTLTRIADSRLASIFSGRWDRMLPRDKHGKIFLDLDPDLFMKILLLLQDEVEELVIEKADQTHFERLVAYLHLHDFVYGGGGLLGDSGTAGSGGLIEDSIVNDSGIDRKNVKGGSMAQSGSMAFNRQSSFGISALREPLSTAELLPSSAFITTYESSLLGNGKYASIINEWLAESFKYSPKSDELGASNLNLLTNIESSSSPSSSRLSVSVIYRASRDGWNVSDFHDKCDGKGATITVVRCGQYLFGGFTRIPWSSSGNFKQDPSSFLFSLEGPPDTNRQPTKLKGNPDIRQHVFHDSRCGPTFGGNHDLHLATAHDGVQSDCYSHLGISFPAPSGQNSETYLAGSHRFLPTEMEILRVDIDKSDQVEDERLFFGDSRAEGLMTDQADDEISVMDEGGKGNAADTSRISVLFQHLRRVADLEAQELEHEEKVLLDQERLFEEDKRWLDSIDGDSGELDEILSLNINGVIFCTRRSTLCSIKGSVLESQFSARWATRDVDRDEEGNIFVEGSPYIFSQIIKWLRLKQLTSFLGDDQIFVPRPIVKTEEKTAFWNKANYYGLSGVMRGNMLEAVSPLLEQCSRGTFCLLSWLPPIESATLIYSASRDGSTAADFHRQCSGHGNTLTIVRSGSYLFGGFASVAWATPLGASTLSVQDPHAFLFSLEAEDNREPTQLFGITRSGDTTSLSSVCHNPNYCAAFGGTTGFDLYLSSSIREPGRQSTLCTSTLGNSFKQPAGASKTKYLAGKQSFRPDDWEVISLHISAT